MMSKLVILIVLLISSPALADSEKWWGATDTTLELTVFTTLALDYLQTRQITADGLESNTIMGERGERLPPSLYFLSAAIVHSLAAYALPPTARRIFQGVTIGFEINCLADNYQAGYSFRF